VPYHAYSTYIQISNQANGDKKPIKKVQTTPKTKKNYTKIEKFSPKFSQNYMQKGYMSSPYTQISQCPH